MHTTAVLFTPTPCFGVLKTTFCGSQERYQQALALKTSSSTTDDTTTNTETTSSEVAALQDQLSQLQKELAEKSTLLEEARKELAEKSTLLEEARKGGEEGGGAKSETKQLKMKAQMTSRIKSLEKDLAELRQVSSCSFIFIFYLMMFVC